MWYRSMADRPLDGVIVVPPPSPSETNPPLGPAILVSSAAEHGLSVAVADLNITYLNGFHGKTPTREALAVGDHGKDRAMLAAATEKFFRDTGLREQPSLYAPDTADPAAGMHVGFDALENALKFAVNGPSPWSEWLERKLFDIFDPPPPVLGVSIMGPSQAFLAATILALSKRRWPRTLTVLGGSHITILAEQIAMDERYRPHVDVVLPGHSERELSRFIASTTQRQCNGITREKGRFPYLPVFAPDLLNLFDRDKLTIPLQFTRGCAYGRCTFCTYPVVEQQLSGFDVDRAHRAIVDLVAEHAVTRFSIKDSLFTLPRILSLANVLIAEGTSIQWSATTKATRALIGHAPRLAESGLATLEIGVETIHRKGQDLFDKRADRAMLKDVLLACAENGITVVTNLIFGLPGESASDADAQLNWFLDLRSEAPPGRIEGSLNMLEIVRGSPLALRPPPDVQLLGVAPWAYCYAWNSPSWRTEYVKELQKAEMLG
jgi:hypothetical protein